MCVLKMHESYRHCLSVAGWELVWEDTATSKPRWQIAAGYKRAYHHSKGWHEEHYLAGKTIASSSSRPIFAQQCLADKRYNAVYPLVVDPCEPVPLIGHEAIR